jgi:hypothetical protein
MVNFRFPISKKIYVKDDYDSSLLKQTKLISHVNNIIYGILSENRIHFY